MMHVCITSLPDAWDQTGNSWLTTAPSGKVYVIFLPLKK